MKYKIGDRVRLADNDNLSEFAMRAMSKLEDKAAIITHVSASGCYWMKEIDWVWSEDEIECFIEHTIEEINRFELIDFD